MGNVILTVLLSVSISIQLAAAILAVANTRLTPQRFSWVLISSAIVLMTVRRTITLVGLINSWETPATIRWSAEVTALLISILMVSGMWLLRQTLRDVSKSMASQSRVLRESLHTSKNNLQSLASLLHSRASFAPSEAARDLIVELEQKVAVYSLLQQKLFEHHSSVVLSEYFDELTATIEDAYSQPGRFAPVRHDFWGFREVIAREADAREVLYAGLILGEALINAFKYSAGGREVASGAMPGGDGAGRPIQITAEGGVTSDGTRWLCVSDDGAGFPDDVLNGTRSGFGLAFLSGMSRDGWSITWGNRQGAWIRAEF